MNTEFILILLGVLLPVLPVFWVLLWNHRRNARRIQKELEQSEAARAAQRQSEPAPIIDDSPLKGPNYRRQ